MVEYSITSAWSKNEAVWSRTFLQPLAPGALTPFSYSMLAEIVGRAWYAYFDRLGFEPTPRAQVVRQFQGRPYTNLSLSAELDAVHAGIEPVQIRIDGHPYPLCQWTKPGFLAGMKFGRNARKLDELLQTVQDDLDAIKSRARIWLQKVDGLHWSQAEILQVMEEIERVGVVSMTAYFAARHQAEYAYGQLLALLDGVAQGTGLLARVLADGHGLIETAIGEHILALAAEAKLDQGVYRWLSAGDFGSWREQMPAGAFATQFQAFLDGFGHRCKDEGELANSRWSEDPTPVLRALQFHSMGEPAAQAFVAGPAVEQELLSAVASKDRKAAQQWLGRLARCLPLQSQALDAYAYVLAGTRRWALAAAREAMGDQRLSAQDEVFFYELEEIKQMMTGEWNVSDLDGIRAIAAGRRSTWETWQSVIPGPLLLGDVEAHTTAPIPLAPGVGSGLVGIGALSGPGSILVEVQPDCGASLWLPGAHGLVAAQGSPIDPVSAAAVGFGVPGVGELGPAYARLSAGTMVTIDGDSGTVTQDG